MEKLFYSREDNRVRAFIGVYIMVYAICRLRNKHLPRVCTLFAAL